MNALELKIPPPAVALLIAIAMWGISRVTPPLEMPDRARDVAGLALAIAGAGISVAGVLAFRRARTTVNPVKPEAATSLVTSGVYGFTRNPMYLGLCLALLAWGVFLASALALLGAVVFVLYMNRFQIEPEERVLFKIFGTAFTDYRSRVRRWL